MRWVHLDLLAVCGLAACMPSTSPATPVAPTEVRPAPVVPIAAVPPPPTTPDASPPALPTPPVPAHDEPAPLVDAGSLTGFPDYRPAPWWTPPPKPPQRSFASNPVASIARAMPRFRRALRRCYENSLKSNPNMHGQVSVRFTVGRDGRVVAVETKQNPSLDGLARCIRATVQRVHFPPQDPPAQVSFPIIFVDATYRPADGCLSRACGQPAVG